MPRLVSKILQSILVVPFGAIVFTLIAALTEELLPWQYARRSAVMTGGGTWLFMIVYWTALWRSYVLWTRYRTYRTLASGVLCAGAGAAVGYFSAPLWGLIIASGLGGGGAAFAWMGWTTVIWRQTREEAGAAAPVACPVCGYNLSGLKHTTCPECGASLTLEQLLSRQRSEEVRSLKS